MWSLMSVLGLPLMAVRETYEEGKDLLLKWRQNVAEYQAELQRRQVGGGGGRGGGFCRRACVLGHMHWQGGWLSMLGWS